MVVLAFVRGLVWIREPEEERGAIRCGWYELVLEAERRGVV